MKHEVWVEKIFPALILFSLWLDGWFFPLILLPVLYVLLVEKKSLGWIGFSRHELCFSLVIGVLTALVLSGIYYQIFLYYLTMMKIEIVTIYSILLDVIWYPAYEEVAYRSFVLTHFAELDKSYLSTKNLVMNLFSPFFFCPYINITSARTWFCFLCFSWEL